MAELRATKVLSDDWQPLAAVVDATVDVFVPGGGDLGHGYGTRAEDLDYVGGDRAAGGGRVGAPAPEALDDALTQEEIRRQLTAVRIEVADFAHTSSLYSDGVHDYLKTELGMNIVVPSGKIRQLRFQVRLEGDEHGPVEAIDGFPKDIVDDRAIVSGTVTLSVDKAFKLLAAAAGTAVAGPAAGALATKAADVANQVVKLKIDPWKFSCGDIRNVTIDFSEAQTDFVEWWFKGGGGIKNALGVVLTLRKGRKVARITGDVRALWEYETHFWSKKTSSDTKRVAIFPG